MKALIIISFFIILACLVTAIIIFTNCKIDEKFTSKPSKPSKSYLISRKNTYNYLKNLDSDFIKIIRPDQLSTFTKNISPNTILFVIDDPFNSICTSSSNHNNFLDNPNLKLCMAENWLGEAHPKLKRWPIGLESKKYEDFYWEFINSPIIKKNKKILCNANLRIFNKPDSGYRNDRGNMINELNNSPRVDMWESRRNVKDTFKSMKESYYELCPEGNGLDTHRFYEAYALGEKRIIRKGPLTSLHSQFPGTIVVNEWKDVDNLKLDYSKFEPDLEMITLGYWLNKSLRSRCVIMTFFTGGLCHEWKNLIYTLKKVGLADLVVAFVLDDEAKMCAQKEGIKIREDFKDNNFAKKSSFMTKEFVNIMLVKLQAINKLLNEGNIVFYLDTDIVVQKDLVKDFFNLPTKDIYIQSDHVDFRTENVSNHCAGVMFIMPTKNAIRLFKNAIKIFPKCTNNSDQEAINESIKRIKVDVGVLDPKEYPNGIRYFEQRNQCAQKPFLIHNNWIVGTDNKVKRFKEHGLWYI